MNEYRARSKETPLWKEELRRWTIEILKSLDSSESKQAVEELSK